MADFPVRSLLFTKLELEFKPLKLELTNESPMHGLPESAEKHFKLEMVSAVFVGLSRIDRQRRVNEILREELKLHVHALTMRLMTPDEWEKLESKAFSSPPCLGGSKRS